MKKVGLLTIHKAYNYGAVLQAYASMKTLEKLGFEARIIDYTTKTEVIKRKFLLMPVSRESIKQDIRNIIHPVKFFSKRKRYESFFDSYYKTTSKQYNCGNYQEIALEDFDYLVTGSDQTFALNLLGSQKEREVFFLPFKTRARKLSYSSSVGEKTKLLSDESKQFMKTSLYDYKKIAVRESHGADLIEALIGIRPEITFDPTLCLSRDDWDKIAKPIDVTGKYIFFYTVLSEPWVIEYVKKVSEKFDLPIVALHSQNRFEVGCNFIRKDDCGPGEFITLLKNAEYVVTTSFHGTVFSLIYEKRFLSLVLSEGNRIRNLFDNFGSSSNLVTKENNTMEFPVVDSDKVKAFIDRARQTNERYLKDTIV